MSFSPFLFPNTVWKLVVLDKGKSQKSEGKFKILFFYFPQSNWKCHVAFKLFLNSKFIRFLSIFWNPNVIGYPFFSACFTLLCFIIYGGFSLIKIASFGFKYVWFLDRDSSHSECYSFVFLSPNHPWVVLWLGTGIRFLVPQIPHWAQTCLRHRRVSFCCNWPFISRQKKKRTFPLTLLLFL